MNEHKVCNFRPVGHFTCESGDCTKFVLWLLPVGLEEEGVRFFVACVLSAQASRL